MRWKEFWKRSGQKVKNILKYLRQENSDLGTYFVTMEWQHYQHIIVVVVVVSRHRILHHRHLLVHHQIIIFHK